LLVTGPCGVGKSWLSCALAQKACRDGYSVHYARVPRLFADLDLAHGDGRFARLFRMLVRVDLLVLDDWGPDRLSASQRRDLMEIVEDRHGRGSILITSQLPVATWHDVIGEPTLGDAILDRIVHNAYRLELDGPSMRKLKAGEATEPPTASHSREQGNEAQTHHRGRPRGSTGTSASAVGALRGTRGSLLLTTGTASTALDVDREH
jgi:DNA replication protein DnaC